MMLKLFDYKLEKIDSDLVKFLLEKNYDQECKVENKQCENCINAWLISKMREKFYANSLPLDTYKKKLNLYLENKDYFDLTSSYKMSDDFTLSIVPSNKEESIVFTPHIEKYYDNRILKDIENGVFRKKGLPPTTYGFLISTFQEKFNNTPIPIKYVGNEIKRIEELIDKQSPLVKKSFTAEYNSIINCEDAIFGWDSFMENLMRFYLRSETLPYARHKIFLDKKNLETQTLKVNKENYQPRLYLEQIDSFIKIKECSLEQVQGLLKKGRIELSEEDIQVKIEEILNVPFHKKDWAGEQNDLYTNNIYINEKQIQSAFLLKGKGKKARELQIADCGKNGNQILRLFKTCADLYFIQYVGPISEDIIEMAEIHSHDIRRTGKEVKFCIIDGQETARLLRAYNKI